MVIGTADSAKNAHLVFAEKALSVYGSDAGAYEMAELLTASLTAMQQKGFTVASISTKVGVIAGGTNEGTKITTTVLRFGGGNRRISISTSSKRTVEIYEGIGVDPTER
jgi:hypothetical protein